MSNFFPILRQFATWMQSGSGSKSRAGKAFSYRLKILAACRVQGYLGWRLRNGNKKKSFAFMVGPDSPFCILSGDLVYDKNVKHMLIAQQDLLKGPKHDQVEGEFFYIKQTRMVR